MLAHPRAQEALNEFVSQWLRFDRVLTATRDRRKYPTFTRETAVAMTEEARTFVADLVWNDRNFMIVVHGRLRLCQFGTGRHLQSPGASEGVRSCSVSRGFGARRPARSGSVSGADVEARRFIADSARPVRAGAVPLSACARSAGRSEHESAAGDRGQAADQSRTHVGACDKCKLRDLSQADGSRSDSDSRSSTRWARGATSSGSSSGAKAARATNSESPVKTVDLDLDTSGNVAGIRIRSFSSPAELGAVLAKSPQCQECIVKQYFRYTAGRMETPADRPAHPQSAGRFPGFAVSVQRAYSVIGTLERIPGRSGAAHVASDHQSR